ncbi:MAG: DUF2147 domain-containing protein [Burkholderiales bacterium]|nr:DUF2147 domain-containing protein [Burkholderiales bacterium]
MRTKLFLSISSMLLAGMHAQNCWAKSQTDAQGFWLSADKAAVIEFKECTDAAGSICGKIVWDKDAGTSKDACGVLIAKLARYDNDAWKNGWVFDPRTGKYYKGTVRVKGEKNEILAMRAFIGTELLGETEEMTRVSSVQPGCKK